MVAWFIIALATLAVFAFIAINGVQTVSTTTDAVGRVETIRRLDGAASALLSRSGSPSNSGRMMLLAGTTVNGVYGLPSELSSYASTPFGQRIVYCPFGDGEAGTATVSIPAGGGTNYSVQTRPDASGRLYVTAGRPGMPELANNPNLMGYLIAPRTKLSQTPGCSAVRFNTTTRRFEAPDAIVRAIIRASSADDMRQQAAREVVFYVSQGGTGRGLSASDPTSLYNAVTYYRSSLPQAMRIVMQNGSYVLPAQYLNGTVAGFSDKGNAGTLVIDGGNSDLAFDGLSDIWVPGNLEIRNLTVSTAVGIWADRGNQVTLTNTTSGHLYATGGGILRATNVTVADTRLGQAVTIQNGASASFAGTANIYAQASGGHVSVSPNSRLVTSGSTLNLSSSGGSHTFGVDAQEGSNVTFSDSTVNLNSSIASPILVRGRVTFERSVVANNVANGGLFLIRRGGSLALNGGTYGDRIAPQFGIIDYGSSGVSGNAIVRASTACWVGDGPSGVQFAQSATGQGASSSVTADETPPTMAEQPTREQVQLYSAAVARNTQRAQLRNTNTSFFTCQM